jgi:hypothetical protein
VLCSDSGLQLELHALGGCALLQVMCHAATGLTGLLDRKVAVELAIVAVLLMQNKIAARRELL